METTLFEGGGVCISLTRTGPMKVNFAKPSGIEPIYRAGYIPLMLFVISQLNEERREAVIDDGD